MFNELKNNQQTSLTQQVDAKINSLFHKTHFSVDQLY